MYNHLHIWLQVKKSDIQLSHVGPIYGLIHGETFELIRRI